MKKRYWAPLLVALSCCMGFRTCTYSLTEEEQWEYVFFKSKPFANGYHAYAIHQSVTLNRPVKCYRMNSAAVTQKHAGSLIVSPSPNTPWGAVKETEYKELPVGTIMLIERFVMNSAFEIDPIDARKKAYFFTVKFSGQEDKYMLFIGYDNRLFPFPWDSPKNPEEAFTPPDIEKLFPNGQWVLKREKKTL